MFISPTRRRQSGRFLLVEDLFLLNFTGCLCQKSNGTVDGIVCAAMKEAAMEIFGSQFFFNLTVTFLTFSSC